MMLVLSMNSKRQRRPNVRLGEIGDVSAAFACGVSQRTEEKLGHKRWKHDFVNPQEFEHNPISICGFSKFTASEPGVSPRISADLQQNRENKNPNSSKMASEFASSDELDMTKSGLDFSKITRKSRVMKRRGRGPRSNNSVFGGTWSSKISPEFSSEDGRECGGKDIIGFASNACNDDYPDNSFKDLSDQETPATSKEACEYDMYESTYDARQQGNLNDSWKEDACYEGNNAFAKSGGVWDEMGSGGSDVNSVKRWLEELGFGKYAGVFEMHEVDEEALPLLTLEDLKEMGVFAAGPRRKLFNAIQQLKGEDVSA